MKLVLLSGGSGKRLWPLSNDARSKQFLRILDGPGGARESMVERVWRQLGEHGLQQAAHIAAGRSQVELIRSHAGADVPLIIEPERRDTFPAIALAAVYLYSIAGVSLEETITILPVDPYVESDFFAQVQRLGEVLEASGAELALMGVAPTHPSEKYGYIVTDAAASSSDAPSYRKVRRFTEKPREAEARALIAEGALWNCGVFAFKLGYLINLLMARRLPLHYDEMVRRYASLGKSSFDYEVVERAADVAVLPYDGAWKDLGTWNTLTEEMGTQTMGSGIVTADAANTHVINALGIPITVLGLTDAVVAAGPDGILVTDKQASPRIKEVMAHLQERPMYEERRWGRYQVLDRLAERDGSQVMTKRVSLEPGRNFSYHYHLHRSEVWTVLSGEGRLVLQDELRPLRAGETVQIPAGCRHALQALTAMELIEVMRGSELGESDIVRLDTAWPEIVGYCAT
ncbi:cupin domain-containing protein [Paenibacillus sp. IB182496]|uniref:Cupin domain-containing protein n=1 Tax=Paenibacillus sabuli TaxID=2772509 RepID=A0A927BSF6_9BACL|nr:sugar phosphate nucleotidyltransferase [Paenibacillus sabuli]MBD2845938.1 cupin domain-containing protein [Paenibacillus sabuli]